MIRQNHEVPQNINMPKVLMWSFSYTPQETTKVKLRNMNTLALYLSFLFPLLRSRQLKVRPNHTTAYSSK